MVNFRNKQWFKNLAQEHKDEICKEFDITEDVLKRAGYEENDHIYIDLLKVSYPVNTERLNPYKDIVLSDIFKKLIDIINIDDIDKKYQALCAMHSLFFKKDAKAYKEKPNDLLTSIRIKERCNYINNIYKRLLINDDDPDAQCIFSEIISSHLKVLLESDLQVLK